MAILPASMRTIISVLLLCFFWISSFANTDWNKILRKGMGKVTFYWYPNNVNILDSKDIIDGVEHDLAFAFINYLEGKYNVSIEVEWIEVSGFDEVLSKVKNGDGGVFGASSISITEERAKELNFTPPYLADIAVLVTSANIPIANTPDEFQTVLKEKNAVTIQSTTLKESLLQLDEQLGLDFNVQYVTNSGEVIEQVEQSDNSVAYIDLPNFLSAIKNSSKIRRQFFYPIQLEGLAMVFPKSSDWKIPVQDYFTSDQFIKDKKQITLRYFGEDIGNIIDQISKSADIGPFEEIMISNREKESRYEELIEIAKREKDKTDTNIALTVLLAFVGFGGFFLLVSNRVKSQVNRVLREKQEIIEERNQELKKLNEEKNDLIRVVAHDLRSPLSNIQGCSMLLQERKNLDDETLKMAEFITQASERIQSMISKILDVDAIESGERNMKLELVRPCDVVTSVLEDNKKRAKKKQIELIGKEETKAKVIADRFYLTQVIENLINNAIKYSESNTKVTVSVVNHEKDVRVIVKDEGPGFTSEDENHLFKKFQQFSARPTGGEKSVGLGLSIVKSYTEMMGGTVTYKTELGKGTAFYIDFHVSEN